MQTEDTAAAFFAIVTLVLNLIPQIVGLSSFPTEYSGALLAIAVILKGTLQYILPAASVTYTVSANDPQGRPYSGSTIITPPDTVAAATARLQALGFTNVVMTAQ